MCEVEFRPLASTDFPLLVSWQASPHVAAWWRDPSDLASIEAQYGRAIAGTDPTEVFVITVDDEPVGMIQRYRVGDHPSWERALRIENAAGIDYYLGVEELTGRGLGTRVIAAFSAAVFRDYPEIERIAVAPQQANVASWRALENAGYERVWSGKLDSDDPSDAGPSFIYVLECPTGASPQQVMGTTAITTTTANATHDPNPGRSDDRRPVSQNAGSAAEACSYFS